MKITDIKVNQLRGVEGADAQRYPGATSAKAGLDATRLPEVGPRTLASALPGLAKLTSDDVPDAESPGRILALCEGRGIRPGYPS